MAMRAAPYVFMALLAASPAHSAEPLKGVALTIGNGDYATLSKLPNPVKDADDFQKLFAGLGFKTESTSDRDLKRLQRDLDAFVEDAEGADVAVLSYSGHGIEAGGENWLVPVDADLSALDDAGVKLVALSPIVKRLQAKVPVVIVLLDACRNSPFPAGAMLKPAPQAPPVAITASGLGDTRSVVPMDGGKTEDGRDNLGTVIGFSAPPGKKAQDGLAGANSPYAAAVLKHLDAMAGAEFGVVMRMITEEVYLKTGGQQRPWVNESLRRLLYFGKTPSGPTGDEGDILKGRRALLVSIAALPEPDRQQIERVALDGGVPMDALYGMLEALGADRPRDEKELGKLLKAQTARLKSMLAEQQAIRSKDPEIIRLSSLADRAIREGTLSTAINLNERAKKRVETLTVGIEQAEQDIRDRRIEFAEVFANSAKAYALSFDYLQAAEDYEKAFRQVEGWDAALAYDYRLSNADALRDYGKIKGGIPWIEKAVAAYDAAIALRPRDRNPQDWAAAMQNKAIAVSDIGERLGDMEKLNEAVGLYKEVLTIWTEEKYPQQWATIVNNVALVVDEVGDYGGVSYDREAASLLRRTLAEFDRERHPADWAMVQQNLGNAYVDIAERTQEDADARQAIAYFNASLEVYAADTAPHEWMRSQVGLGVALNELASITKDGAYFEQARRALEAAIMVVDRETFPDTWAAIRNNMGKTHGGLADLGAGTEHLLAAKVAYADALSERSIERSPLEWGITAYNLASTLDHLGDATGDRKHYDEAAALFAKALEVLTPEAGHQYHAWAYNNYSNTLRAIYKSSGTLGDLQKLIDVNRHRLTLYPEDSAPWAGLMNDIGYDETVKAGLKGDFSHLPEVLDALNRALQVWDSIGREESASNTQGNICLASVELADAGGDSGAVSRSVSACERAVARSRSIGEDTGDVVQLLERARRLEALANR